MFIEGESIFSPLVQLSGLMTLGFLGALRKQ